MIYWKGEIQIQETTRDNNDHNSSKTKQYMEK